MAPSDPSGKTLLIVEDNAVAREGLAALLRQAGHTVTTAEDGRQALEQLRAGPLPDLILLDMLMPVLDGWHFLTELERSQLPRPVPVIITTGTILTRAWAQSRGCAGFLRKPIDEAELYPEVERCLAAAG